MEPIDPKRPILPHTNLDFGAWLASRRWRKILPAAPAVVVALSITGTCLWTYSRPADLQPRYLQALTGAVDQDETESAQRYANKLVSLGAGERPEVQWIGTLIDIRQGRLQQAQTSLEQLAPSQSTGYPYAHLYVAKRLAAGSDIDNETAELLKHHLHAASTIPAEQPWIANLLSQIYLAQDDFNSATQQLKQIVSRQPATWMVIAKIKQQQGETDAAKKAFASAAEHFAENVSNDPSDDSSRIMLAQATLQTEGFRAAETILLTGLRRNPEAETMRAALASLYLHQADTLRQSETNNGSTTAAALQLIERALKLAPNHPVAMQRLLGFLDDSGFAKEQADQILGELLASGNATATAHLLLATRAMLTGDDDTARLHMELGYKKDPNLPVLLNNLAWLVARQEQPDLEEALGYAEKAIMLIGTDTAGVERIRDTRGHILIKMQRWQAAIDDLESALPVLNDRAKLATHQALATAYRALGQAEIAAAHDKQVAALELTLPTVN